MGQRVVLAHRIDGRVRLRGPRDLSILERIAGVIRAVEGVTDVDVSPRTGSILVHYEGVPPDQFVRELNARGEQEDSFFVQIPATPGDPKPASINKEDEALLTQNSRAADAVINMVSEVDLELKRATKNFVDLSFLLPASLAYLSARNAGRRTGTPFWVTLAIQAFNSFRSLHADNSPEPDSKS